ncbi:MAG: glycosyltransferase family 4 protein [Cyanobacterium sp. T60_A2020_053]|nr:glycosyltransferase family 4 protein [Cyanobacterium sp. T60_A2020_053]
MTLNKTIVFCASDLEEEFYRGIGFYAQSVIRATKNLGYNNYLLTSAKKEKIIPLQQLEILRNIDKPINPSQKKIILHYLYGLLGKYKFKHISQVEPSYYETISKLNYLVNIDGYINKTSLYKTINLHSILFDFPLTIDTKKADILFCSAPSAVRNNYRGGLTVQTIHDIIPLVTLYHPPSDKFNSLFYKNITTSLKYADIVLTISEFSRQEVLRIFPKFADKLKVIYQPIPIAENELKLAESDLLNRSTLNKFGLRKERYLLYIGALEKRKNIDRLIEAYLAVKNKIKMPLLLVGSLGYGSEIFTGKMQSEGIRYLGYVSNLDKLILLKNANCFVFPSLYEGFGLPPLEAMTMGCPVITSNISAIPEACGNAPLYINPNSIEDMAERILEIHDNYSLRKDIINKGYQQVKKYSLENYQRDFSELFN